MGADTSCIYICVCADPGHDHLPRTLELLRSIEHPPLFRQSQIRLIFSKFGCVCQGVQQQLKIMLEHDLVP